MEYNSTILIVDDNPLERKILEGLLRNQHYRLIFAGNGQEALERASELVPDLIILDVIMPDIDGFEVCRRLRADPLLIDVPVIMVTTLEDRNSRLKGIKAGADDFVLKPFDHDELLTRVKTITKLNRFRRLQEERSKFEWVVEEADDGYLIISYSGVIRYANQQARQYLNISLDENEVPEKSFKEIIKEQYRFEPAEAWEEGLWPKNNDIKQAPRYLVRPESLMAQSFWIQVDTLHVGLSTKLESDGVVRLRDVTSQMALHRDVWQFQSMINHKLRTPLMRMLGGMEMLANHTSKLSAEEISRLASRAFESVKTLRSEIDAIVRYMAAPSLSKRGTESGFELSRLKPIVAEIGAGLGLEEIVMSFQDGLEVGLERLSITTQALESILQEVLENAKKFHPKQSPAVSINAFQTGNEIVCIQITDNGLTLSPEQLTQVWTPYYQGEKYFTGQVEGMGLGLSMVALLIWNTGGSCRIYNRADGPGVVVELEIPREE